MSSSSDIRRSTNIPCPMCDVDVTLAGDEKIGEQIICLYCQTPLKLKKRREDDTLYLEEDF